MRYGFTTGSCAAAGAKAACYMLLSGKIKNSISIMTPKGVQFDAQIMDIKRQEKTVSCAVIKDGGDDPDITTGAYIYATVSLSDSPENRVFIDGGRGVGRVTLPGLDQPVGNAAINHVPREMIEKELLEVMEALDYKGSVSVIISVPEGEELALKTFNPRLGIVGGISILGTSGVVEPMSSQALKDTIRVELSQKKALGNSVISVTPGNYGLDFMKESYGFDLDRSVKCSNFIGDTIDMAVSMGFEELLLTGHIGKLIKLSGGIMNTHSHEGDCRMELLAACAIKAGASLKTASGILESVTTEEGVRILKEAGLFQEAMDIALSRIMFYLGKRGQDRLHIEVMMYSNQFGLLGKSAGAEELLLRLKDMER